VASWWGTDALRPHALHAVRDESQQNVLAELAARVHATSPRALVISETGFEDERALEEWGHDARWSDGLHHALHALLTGEREGHYASFSSIEDVVRELRRRPPEPHVVCAQHHHQLANRAP